MARYNQGTNTSTSLIQHSENNQMFKGFSSVSPRAPPLRAQKSPPIKIFHLNKKQIDVSVCPWAHTRKTMCSKINRTLFFFTNFTTNFDLSYNQLPNILLKIFDCYIYIQDIAIISTTMFIHVSSCLPKISKLATNLSQQSRLRAGTFQPRFLPQNCHVAVYNDNSFC